MQVCLVQKTEEILNVRVLLNALGVVPGMTCADFGCGRSGQFVLCASQMVGETGRVFAIDILKSALQSVTSLAQLHGRHNITCVWADLDRPNSVHIPAASVDTITLVNMARLITQGSVLETARDLLKPNGRLLVVDWRRPCGRFAPACAHQVTEKQACEWLVQKGWCVKDTPNAGAFHWALVCEV